MGEISRMLCIDDDRPIWLEETIEGAWMGSIARLIPEGV